MVFEITIVLLLLVLNGFFAMSELAVVSARRGRLQQLAGAGDRGAEVALELDPATEKPGSAEGVPLTGARRFESSSLQRRIGCEPDSFTTEAQPHRGRFPPRPSEAARLSLERHHRART
jgi:Cyclin M transmembrane N-terminal domain